MKRIAKVPTRFLALAALVGLLLLPGTPARATFPGADGRIAFDDFTTGQIFALNPDGSGLVQLTHVHDGNFTGDPDWSPDGRHIAFESTVSGAIRVWVMTANGHHAHMVMDDRAHTADWVPVYTPDGASLVYTRCVSRACAIYSIRVDGTRRRQLTPLVRPPFEVFDFDPAVSPNGKRIAFERFNQNVNGVLAQIYVMRADGSNAHPITPPRLEAWAPGWSPDGRRITFTSACCRRGRNAFVINADGTGLQKLTGDTFPHNSFQSTFSPAGDRMAFASDRRYSDLCCTDMFLMRPDGSHQALVRTGQFGVEDIAWGSASPIVGSSADARLPASRAEGAPGVPARCLALPTPVRRVEGCGIG